MQIYVQTPVTDAVTGQTTMYTTDTIDTTQPGSTNSSGVWNTLSSLGQQGSDYMSYLSNTLGSAISSSLESIFGKDGKGGLLNNNNALGWANLGLNGYLGYNQLGLARDARDLANEQWAVQKDYMNKNWQATKSDYNRKIDDIANNREKITGQQGYADDYKKQYHIA